MSEDKKPTGPSQEAADARAYAEAEKFRAETEVALANARKAHAEAQYAENAAANSVIELEREEESRARELATDEYQHVYRFTSAVTHEAVGACMRKLTQWSRMNPQCTIEVVFTSPGGSALHGFALFDFLRSLSRQGHTILTTDLGYSASMAGILLQAGDVRRMGQESYFHIHEISTGMVGKVSELEDEVEFCKKMTKRVVDIFVSRSGGKINGPQLRRMFERKEAWFSSDEALKYGLVDEVI